MLISSIILVLREVLEATLLISILFTISKTSGHSLRWGLFALATGIIGASFYATMLPEISASFSGIGQELTNAILQLTLIILLFSIGFIVILKPRSGALVAIMIVAVALAATREGSEIILYYAGFFAVPDLLTDVLIGGFIGLGIGISTGALFYYLLLNIGRLSYMKVTFSVLALVCAGLASQAINLLQQADIITAGEPLWDSSGILSEYGIVGQLLYALVGYEATPSRFQATAYFSVILFYLAITFTTKKFNDNATHSSYR